VQPFAQAIRGYPTIRSFNGGYAFPYDFLDKFYSALATLPALESITCYDGARSEDESTLTNLKSLTELLRVPTLRSVHFRMFSFTSAICQAIANSLIEGTVITNFKFSHCTFSSEECAIIMANGLTRNTSVISISVMFPFDEALVSALATVLISKSTLRQLSFSGELLPYDFGPDFGPDLSPVLLALENNTALKTLLVDVARSIDDDKLLCTAMKDGLKMNSTLENLDLTCVEMLYNAALWHGALSFLRTNKNLKFLSLSINDDYDTASCLSSFLMDIAAMLEENVTLERLSILCKGEINVEDYVTFIAVLRHNTTLINLELRSRNIRCPLMVNADGERQMASFIKTNYGLESLPDIEFRESGRGRWVCHFAIESSRTSVSN
jgi:hypothetical protein